MSWKFALDIQCLNTDIYLIGYRFLSYNIHFIELLLFMNNGIWSFKKTLKSYIINKEDNQHLIYTII